jgi:hypothetical protein
MKRRDKRLSEEIEAVTLLAMIDALDDFELKDRAYCDGCGAKVLRSNWNIARFRSDYCQVYKITGMPERDEKARREKEDE